MINTRPLEVTDFSGGITDYYLDGEPNQAEILDNFFLRPNRRPITRWGSQPAVTSQVPLGQFRVSYLHFLWDAVAAQEKLLTFAQKRVYENDGSTWTETLSPTSSSIFTDGDGDSLISASEWRGHLLLANSDFSDVQKAYYDDTSDLKVVSAGLPEFPSGTSIVSPPGSGSTYSYLFIFRNEYKVGEVTHLDRGPITSYPGIVTGGTITTGNGSVITLPTTIAIPGNYDISTFQVEIYRTQDADADYFLVDTVPFGTPNYTDEVEDATLASSTPIYGTLSYLAPPKCKYVHVVNETGYYGHIKESNGEIDRYKVMQSIPGDADSVPAVFFEKVEQEITGLSSIFDRPIALCKNYIYRIDSVITSDGGGAMDPRRIDDRAGCVSNNSVVQTHLGLFWAGNVGFYWTDGFKVQKISDNLNETYQNLVANSEKAGRIYGSYDPSTERVFWSVCKEDGSNEVDTIFVLDLKFGIQSSSCFTTLSGGEDFAPTATIVLDETIYRGDSRGYLFAHDRSLFSDPIVDTTESDLSNWITRPITFSYHSCFLDFGSKFMRKFVPRMLVSAANRTNLSLAISSSNDNNRVVGELKDITYKQNITWGDSLPVWGDPSAGWNLQGVIEQWRRFPAGGLRCQYKQVRFTNAEVTIIDSSLFGDVNVDASAKTITLNGTAQFPPGLEGYNAQISNDNYSTDYKVLSQSSNTLVLEDDASKLVTGSFSFQIVGVPKNEILELNGYVIHWSYLSKSHTPFISEG